MTPFGWILAAGIVALIMVSPLIIIGIVEKLRRSEPQTLVWDMERGRWVPTSRRLK